MARGSPRGKRDCLILDLVDVSELSLCTLPSLFGCPRDLDLRGEDASEAAHAWEQIQLDYPELKLAAGAQRRCWRTEDHVIEARHVGRTTDTSC